MSSFFFIPTFWHHSFLWFCAVGTVWTHNMLIQKIGWWNPSLQMFQYGHYWATLLLYMFMFGYNRNTLRWSLLTSAGLGIAEIKMAVCPQGQHICAKQYLWYWDLFQYGHYWATLLLYMFMFGYNRNTLRWSLLTSAGLGIAEIKMAVCPQGQHICAKQYLWYWDLGVGAWMKWMSSSISMIWIFFYI